MTNSSDSGQQSYKQIRVRTETHELLNEFRNDLQANQYGYGIDRKVSFDRAIELAVMKAWVADDPELLKAREELAKAEKAFAEAQKARYRNFGGA